MEGATTPIAAIFLTALSLLLIFIICRWVGIWTWMINWIFSTKEEKANLTRTEGHYNANGYLVPADTTVDIDLIRSGSFKRFETVDHDFNFEMSDLTCEPTLQQPPEQRHDYPENVSVPCGTIEMGNNPLDYERGSYWNDAYNNDCPDSTSDFVSSSPTHRQPSIASVKHPPQPLRPAPSLSHSDMIIHEKYESEKPEKVKFPPKRPGTPIVLNQTVPRPMTNRTASPSFTNHTVFLPVTSPNPSPPFENENVPRPMMTRTASPSSVSQNVSVPMANRTASPPFTNQTVFRPVTSPNPSPPFENQTVPRPMMTRTASPSSVSQNVSVPMANRTASPSFTNQTVFRPVTSPNPSPPFENQTVPRPMMNRTASPPFENQTVPRPMMTRTASPSSVSQNVSVPMANQTASPSFTNQTVFRPVTSPNPSPPFENQTVPRPMMNRTAYPPSSNENVPRSVVNKIVLRPIVNEAAFRLVVNQTVFPTGGKQTVSLPVVNATTGVCSEPTSSPAQNPATSTQACHSAISTLVWSRVVPPPIPPRIRRPPLWPQRKFTLEVVYESEEEPLAQIQGLKRGVSFESICSDTSVVLADLDGPHVTGYLCVGLYYSLPKLHLKVFILEGRNYNGLDGHSLMDTFVRVHLLDNTTYIQTRIYKSSSSPSYYDRIAFSLQPDEYYKQTVSFYVYSAERRECVLIGEGHIPLSDVPYRHAVTTWLKLTDTGQFGTEFGEIMLLLNYQPTTERLSVVVIKARNLIFPNNKNLGNPLVKVYLLKQGKKLYNKKTTTKYQDRNPVYNEALIFTLPLSLLKTLELRVTVADSNGEAKPPAVGHVIMGALATGKSYSHWIQMLLSPRQPISMWHILTK